MPSWQSPPIFFDLEAFSAPVTVFQLTTANTGGAGAPFTIDVYTRVGTALGGPASAGPGSSLDGWNFIGTANAVQDPQASKVSEPIIIPDIEVPVGQTVGFALLFQGAGLAVSAPELHLTKSTRMPI